MAHTSHFLVLFCTRALNFTHAVLTPTSKSYGAHSRPSGTLRATQEVEGFHLKTVQMVVFDEADRLFEMGFAEQLRQIMKAIPENRQTMLVSATMPAILAEFARAGLVDPQVVRLDTETRISPDLRTVGSGAHALSSPLLVTWGRASASAFASASAYASCTVVHRAPFCRPPDNGVVLFIYHDEALRGLWF